MKVVSENTPFKPVITERLRSLMKAKLWRMGKVLHKKSSKQQQSILQRWQEMNWTISLQPMEVREALIQEKENLQSLLEREHKASAQLAEEVESVKKASVVLVERNNSMTKELEHLSNTGHRVQKRKARKSWGEYSQQHKRQRLDEVKDAVNSVLCDKNLEVLDVTVKDNLSDSVLNLADKHSGQVPMDTSSNILNLLLYAEERFRISDAAYHELSMLFSVLPRSCQVKERVKELNDQWEIFPTPDGSIGVQQSLKRQLTERVEHLLHASPMNATFRTSELIRVKLTSDGTNIGKLHVVTFGFTIPEDGMGSAGSHPLCIIKDTEDYEQLKISLKNILDIRDIHTHGLVVQGTSFKIDFMLGGDWKFLACVCGLDSASSKYSCIWCICLIDEHHMDKKWSIIDKENGARTIEDIKEAAKLSKKSSKKYYCSHPLLFDMIPMHKVIIDNLHLFLRISDVSADHRRLTS